VTSSWFFLSTLNYDARSTTHQMHIKVQALRWKLPQNGQTPTFSHVTQGKS